MGVFSSDEEPMWSDVYALQDNLKRLREENEELKSRNANLRLNLATYDLPEVKKVLTDWRTGELDKKFKKLQEENKKLKENLCCPETCEHIATEIMRYSNVCEINLKYKQVLEETLKSLCNSLQKQNILREILQQSKSEQNEWGNKRD